MAVWLISSVYKVHTQVAERLIRVKLANDVTFKRYVNNKNEIGGAERLNLG